MNKVKLHLEDLQVESFAVQPDAAKPGTVLGMEDGGTDSPTPYDPCTWYPTECNQDTCWWTCPISCFYTECGGNHTCWPTCDTCDPAWCPPAA